MANRAFITNKHFYLCLVLIMLVGAAIRLPGMHWLINVTPVNVHSPHPDGRRFVRDALNFRNETRDGYVRGITTHIFVVKLLAEKIFEKTPDLLYAGRLFSLIYGILTLGLVALMVRRMTSSSGLSLLTAGFLSVAPLHVINSHFGTADSAAIFYFYLSAFLGWYHMRTRSQTAFALFAAVIGVTLAIKFSVSLLIPLALVLLFSENRFYKALLASLIIAGSFSFVSFFNYSPWDFGKFLTLLLYDNIHVLGANSRLENIMIHSHSVLSSLGLATALFMIIGLILLVTKIRKLPFSRIRSSALPDLLTRILKDPNTVFFSTFAVQLYLVTGLGVSGIRHTLPFIPLLCFVAALGFRSALLNQKLSRFRVAALFVMVFGYQIYNAIATETIFANDIRYQAAEWLEKNVSPKERVTAFMNYSRVGRKVAFIPRSSHSKVQSPSTYLVTCDLEYNRYFSGEDASKIHHARGGQERLELFRNLFGGRTDYKIVQEFRRKQYAIEQYLMQKGFLRDLETFTPRHYVIFKRIPSNADGSVLLSE